PPPDGPPKAECPAGPDNPPADGRQRPDCPPPKPRHGRLIAYLICLLLLNVALGFYALYALGLVMQFDWHADANTVPIMQVVWMVILAFSPLLLTVLLNRVLYRLFRGRRRFPRGTVLLALLVLIAVQALTVMLTLRYGMVEGAAGVGMGDYIRFFTEIAG
ncbi:MAG: hypothetical protein Q4C13_02220, partial [Clostridia bacterium]|nr:hypothetical protein [Clostridia bacterium]